MAYIVSELQRYSLLNTKIDIKGKAYEEIVGANLRGDRGEFFTPRNVMKMVVEMMNPQINEKVLEKTLPTLIQTNETKKSTQIDAFFESKPKIDAFLKIDANAQRQEYKMAS